MAAEADMEPQAVRAVRARAAARVRLILRFFFMVVISLWFEGWFSVPLFLVYGAAAPKPGSCRNFLGKFLGASPSAFGLHPKDTGQPASNRGRRPKKSKFLIRRRGARH